MNVQHSDIEVVPHNEFSGLQIFKHKSTVYPEVVPGTVQSSSKSKPKPKPTPPKPTSVKKTRRICGARPRIFWVLFAAISTIIISVGVGSFVGITLSRQNYNTQNDNAPLRQNPSTISTSQLPSESSSVLAAEKSVSPTSTLNPPSVTTSRIPGASVTLLSDCPSANDTIYNVTHGDTTLYFRKLCNTLYPNAPGEKINVVKQETSSLNDCIELCATYDILQEENVKAKNVDRCSAVCWRNSSDKEIPSVCFGYQIQNSTSGFVTEEDTVCDSAAWINEW
jgi:hypothetical protein